VKSVKGEKGAKGEENISLFTFLPFYFTLLPFFTRGPAGGVRLIPSSVQLHETCKKLRCYSCAQKRYTVHGKRLTVKGERGTVKKMKVRGFFKFQINFLLCVLRAFAVKM
jgi:hypothetical protein